MMSRQDEAFEKVLTANLSRAIDFVRFAETKNAALLTFASAWIVAIGSLLFSDKKLPDVVVFTLYVVWPFFVVAAVLAIVSLMPKTKLERLLRGERDQTREPNLLFFGDIRSVAPKKLKDELLRCYGPDDDRTTTDRYLDDLCVQIWVNSGIAHRKFELFDWGAVFVLLAIIIMAVVPVSITVIRALGSA